MITKWPKKQKMTQKMIKKILKNDPKWPKNDEKRPEKDQKKDQKNTRKDQKVSKNDEKIIVLYICARAKNAGNMQKKYRKRTISQFYFLLFFIFFCFFSRNYFSLFSINFLSSIIVFLLSFLHIQSNFHKKIFKVASMSIVMY